MEAQCYIAAQTERAGRSGIGAMDAAVYSRRVEVLEIKGVRAMGKASISSVALRLT